MVWEKILLMVPQAAKHNHLPEGREMSIEAEEAKSIGWWSEFKFWIDIILNFILGSQSEKCEINRDDCPDRVVPN